MLLYKKASFCSKLVVFNMGSFRRVVAAMIVQHLAFTALCFEDRQPFSGHDWKKKEQYGGQCKAWLVQSIPTDMPDLPLVPGVLATGDVLQWLAANATEGLDISSQYWQLLAQPDNPVSGDYGFGQAKMNHFGAPVGKAVFDALDAAAARGIPIRIIQHSGFFPDFNTESAAIAAGRPNVQNRTLLLGQWYGSGIVHSKVWVADKKHIYIGSANNDWKSLTQVKELGIFLTDCPEVGEKVEIFLDNLWALSFLNASSYITNIFDEQWQINRQVPCWSYFVSPDNRCTSPLPAYVETPQISGYPYLADPFLFNIQLQTPGGSSGGPTPSTTYISFAPPEILACDYQSDEQGWVQTIRSVPVNGTVRMSTMDWLGQSQFVNPPVYWSVLSSAISEVVFSKHATVKLLVAHWNHSLSGGDDYLRFVASTNTLCSSSTFNKCSGKVEVKLYEVPGFESTGPAIKKNVSTGNAYPDFTRVNHAKYAVSDVRAHIGTSNLIWDYFYVTSGISFGSYNPDIITQLQAVFDADWNSPYAVSVPVSSS
ncbi:hypothetical protein O6H91_11G057000 [Diphasiastrum complanatum]|uniref:Uncharacterized protein n=1 Tax=Diphasiastrum complanatum TaxID=34168 RepID=A0ACC2CAG4_DIPCM|nr:hypothetical protein O6H91_11G057000 [Diphasiastrum complanatum]